MNQFSLRKVPPEVERRVCARLVTLDSHFDAIPTLVVDRYEPME